MVTDRARQRAKLILIGKNK